MKIYCCSNSTAASGLAMANPGCRICLERLEAGCCGSKRRDRTQRCPPIQPSLRQLTRAPVIHLVAGWPSGCSKTDLKRRGRLAIPLLLMKLARMGSMRELHRACLSGMPKRAAPLRTRSPIPHASRLIPERPTPCACSLLESATTASTVIWRLGVRSRIHEDSSRSRPNQSGKSTIAGSPPPRPVLWPVKTAAACLMR